MSAVTRTEQQLASGLWRIDREHSAIEFRVKHLMIDNVTGRFLDFNGTIAGGWNPSVAATIRAASIETHQPERDAHLRSPDFLDVEQHPTILFQSTEIDIADDGTVAVAGKLTIKGRTRPVDLVGTLRHAAGLNGHDRVAFELRGVVNRLDWGLEWNRLLETGGMFVGNKVQFAVDVAAVRDVALERAA
jgi:polyisoprenoid-binding protein YceI